MEGFLFALGILALIGSGTVYSQDGDTFAEDAAAVIIEEEKERSDRRDSGDRVTILSNSHLQSHEDAEVNVTILGSAFTEGEVDREHVTILGNTRLTGSVGNECVTVFGNANVNGYVGNELVVVLGNLTLGPQAEVEDVVVVMGSLDRHPDAIVHGSIEGLQNSGSPFDWDLIHPYLYEGLARGRLIVPSMNWTWLLAFLGLGLTILLVLMFSRPAEACVDMLDRKPVQSIFVGVIAPLLLAPLFSFLVFLLVVTGIGVLVLPFVVLAAGFFWMLCFASVYGIIGRRLGAKRNVALAVAIGGTILTFFYAIPALGVMMALVVGMLGSGAVAMAFVEGLSNRSGASRKAYSTRAFESDPHSEYEISEYERVGFWPRFVATLIDLILVVSVVAIIESIPLFGMVRLFTNNFLLVWFAYHVTLWAWRGTTIGGSVLKLRIERIDGSPISVPVAIIRSLSSVLSFICFGLGLFWSSLDSERQSWHDKIAGTAIVKVRNNRPMI